MRRVGMLFAALLVFLGGVVYANAQSEIFTGCLTPGGDLKNVALGDTPAGDCNRNSLQVSWNAQGPEGPEGPTGPQGPEGAFPNVYFTSAVRGPLGISGSTSVTALCDAGDIALSGGFTIGNAPIDVERTQVLATKPKAEASGIPDGWVTGFAITPDSGELRTWVVCADVAD